MPGNDYYPLAPPTEHTPSTSLELFQAGEVKQADY